MYEMSDEEFDNAVQEALDEMPAQFMDALDNVAIFVADEPSEEELATIGDPGHPGGTSHGGELLGLYSGIALPSRGEYYDNVLPDTITIFKGPHERLFRSREEIVEQARKTVIHEIGHYFGLDDARLHEMGY